MEQIYYGGTILTLEHKNQVEAVLVRDGRVAAVGSPELLHASAPGAAMRSLDGCTLLPAFIDPHSHLSAVANSFLQVPLDEAVSVEEIHDALTDFVRRSQVPEGTWVVAKGYDHNVLPGGRHITRDFLDHCLPKHPVIVQHQSGHSGVCNSLALKKLGITASTPAPQGGVIGQKNGRLNGFLEENAFMTYMKRVPMPDLKAMQDAFDRAQTLYASHGITTVQDGMVIDQMLPMYRYLYEQRALRLDLVSYPDAATVDRMVALFPHSVGQYDRHIRIGGIKTFLDGSPQGRTAWMRTPYQDSDGDCGYGTLSDEALDAVIEKANLHSMQLLAHCNGDAAAAQYLAALTRAESTCPALRDSRPVMIHAQLLDLDQLAAVRATGVIPSFFVAHVYHWGDVHRKNFGEARAARISPAMSTWRAGILFTFHQDSPVIPPDMLETLWCATCRTTKSGFVLGENERLPTEEALYAVTRNAAYQYFEEETKGAIRVGARADFVVLDRNPLAVRPEELRSLRVLATIKDGTVVYSK